MKYSRIGKRQYHTCRKCNTDRQRKYCATKQGKINIFQAVYRSIKKHRDKQSARAKLKYAIDKGIIKRPKSCSICKKRGKIFGHHEDYSKPLKVIWACMSCHCTLDKKMKMKYNISTMPLSKNIGKNIEELYADNMKKGKAKGANGKNRSRAQIIAIAYAASKKK